MERRTRYSYLLQPIQLLADVLVIYSAMIAAISFFSNEGTFFNSGFQGPMGLALVWVLIAILFKPYRRSRASSLFVHLRKNLGFLALHFLIIFCISVLVEDNSGTERILLAAFVFASFGFVIWRTIFDLSLKAYRRQGGNYRNVFIVGEGALAEQMRRYFERNPDLGYRISGTFTEQESTDPKHPSLDKMEEQALSGQVHEIYCCLPELSKEALHRIVRLGEETLIKVKLIGDLGQLYERRLELEHYDHIPVLNVRRIPLDDPFNRSLKRAFDVAFALFVGVAFLSWMLPIIALMIKINSKGPVFFKQCRTGRDGREFWCYKFRTMVPGAELMPEPPGTEDNRITSIGPILRKSSLDELPQFFNVLIGDMSVIGPRPHMVAQSAEFTRMDRKFHARQSIKPGITGLAQAKGFRGPVQDRSSLKDRLKLDRFYLENWSLYFDLKIILLTIRSLVVA